MAEYLDGRGLGLSPEGWNDAAERTADEVAETIETVGMLLMLADQVGPSSFRAIAELVAELDRPEPEPEHV